MDDNDDVFDDLSVEDYAEPDTEAQELLPGYYVDPATGAWCTLPWPTDRAEKKRISDNSLGPLLIRWAENRLTPEEFELFGPGLVHPLTGDDWRFTDGQKKFLILWYQYDDRGRYVFRSGVKRGSKGTGKDPFAGAHGNCELAGPSHLVWDDEKQTWTGQPHRMPLVQVAANSETQAKEVLNTANAMWTREAVEWHGLDIGATRTVLHGRGKFIVLTASEASMEGDPATFVILNESQHMTQTSGGHRIAAVARRNVGKSPEYMQARLCEYTNAHQMGLDSEAERSYLGWQLQVSGKTIGKQDILYDSIEGDPNLRITDADELKLAIKQAYSDAWWSDEERLYDEVLDPRLSVADARRFYLNDLAPREDSWIDPRNWDKLSAQDTVVEPKTKIAMFLDCSKSGDATGLVGVRVSDGFTFVLGVWSPPRGASKDWRVPRHEVDAEVRAAFAEYKIMWFGVDPSPAMDDEEDATYWADLIDAWHQDFAKKLPMWATPGSLGNSVKFDMRLSQRGGVERNKAFTEMAQIVQKWIDEDEKTELRYDGNPVLRQHVHNARKRGNPWGESLSKESRDSKKHIDLAVCMIGGQLGRRLVMNNPKIRTGDGTRPTTRRVAVMN